MARIGKKQEQRPSKPGCEAASREDKGCGVYVHVPFCHSRCLYCAFYSTVGENLRQEEYFAALAREARDWSGWMTHHAPVRSVYFGGGTPSLAEPRLIVGFLTEMMVMLGECFRPEEVTLEVNPEDVTGPRAQAWAEAGVNRFSMGVQSLVDEELRMIGRRHTAEQVRKAAEMLKRYGDLSLDLICGLPGQTAASFSHSLEEVMTMTPEHISIYMLELEDGSALTRLVKAGKREVPDEQAVEEMYLRLCKRLKEEGYEHYEISNFALPGHRSKHNSAYWNGRPYIGLGAAAAGYPQEDRRYVNPADVNAYIYNVSEAREWERLSPAEQAEEYVLTRLRTAEGINLSEYARRFGESAADGLLAKAEEWLQRNLLCRDNDGRLRLASPQACLLSDAILVDLI